jgi:hypothetical protein
VYVDSFGARDKSLQSAQAVRKDVQWRRTLAISRRSSRWRASGAQRRVGQIRKPD